MRTAATPTGWSFDDNNAVPHIKQWLYGHEALQYRSRVSPGPRAARDDGNAASQHIKALPYEHRAMALELLRRMKVYREDAVVAEQQVVTRGVRGNNRLERRMSARTTHRRNSQDVDVHWDDVSPIHLQPVKSSAAKRSQVVPFVPGAEEKGDDATGLLV